MLSIKFIVHYSLHFLAPGLIAYFYNPVKWKKYWLALIGTMLIDLDHLLATPIFDPNRCSVGYHPLHSFPIIYLYLFLLIPKKTRLVAIGIIFHLLTDLTDCLL
ncbi:DUF6122 family protein [Wenyingzhuangia aestuarii]|uniref:DUF6122 family protein n=1 Tax=Wenyingzhuangia aestuarii TaxID=1647582 RepID=UPI00143BD9A3|nr:DUF6122 family protein [Wenyingzhuangia aestuarii]NJB82408.1 hypothetical protein [Wenyingzhuangia aestuarii]